MLDALAAGPLAAAETPLDFNRDIRPILADKCLACHGPDASRRDSPLRLDQEASAKAAHNGRKAIVPRQPEQSELLARITHRDPAERMPPADSGKTLTAGEIERLRRWIAEGAAWAQPWTFVPPVRHDPPPVRDAAWSPLAIDRFLLARWERDSLAPAPDADRATLCRRAAFDLTGLPPTPAEVAAFLADERPDAWERLVERLLASERYGERMASWWLDLVRFADTVGYHGDQDHHASSYRDYVIDAFHTNLPFDRFTQEQLAGDLLPDSGDDQKIASCYNRLLQTSHEGGVQAKEYLAIYAADRIRNLSAVWMGATVGCAQCHDHKFDPYTMRDFYSLVALFADLDEDRHLRGGGADAVPTKRLPELKLLTRRERARAEQLAAQAAALNQQLASAAGETAEALRQQLAELERTRKAVLDAARPVMVSAAVPPREIRLLPRGNWLDDTGPVMPPAVPAFLPQLVVGDRRPTRLDLALWLVDARGGHGGLTARVFVNRVWSLLFGEGLARNLEDFGAQGEPPVHPELLDHLALEFIASGWDVKRLVKSIVLSRAYRQTSLVPPALAQRDPENRLFARQGRFRLPAEMIRDQALYLGGLLVEQVGGASVKPYQPAGYYRHLNFPPRDYQHHADARQWRRGLYVHWQRQFLHPMLKAFDAPSREECTARRARTNTPLAALALLNDPSLVEAARALAARTLAESGADDEARLTSVFLAATSRPPDAVERAALQKLLAANRTAYRAAPETARALLGVGLSPQPTGDPVEQAAWTAVCRAALNLHETNTRN